MYRAGNRTKAKRSKLILWLPALCLAVALAIWVNGAIHRALRPQTVITGQGRAVTTHVSYSTKNKLYNEGDFTIKLPVTWSLLPRTPGPYKSFTWQSSDRTTDGQVIEVYEDTIPTNFAVNRVLVVQGETDHLSLDGSASDNCATFTGGEPRTATGTAARWQGVSFLCDLGNQERDVIGTSSTDGVNTVLLKNSSTGVTHKFFFTYTDYSVNPDYTVFYNALNSFQMN